MAILVEEDHKDSGMMKQHLFSISSISIGLLSQRLFGYLILLKCLIRDLMAIGYPEYALILSLLVWLMEKL